MGVSNDSLIGNECFSRLLVEIASDRLDASEVLLVGIAANNSSTKVKQHKTLCSGCSMFPLITLLTKHVTNLLRLVVEWRHILLLLNKL